MCFQYYIKVYNRVLFFLHEDTIYCIFVVRFVSLLSQPAKLWNFTKLKCNKDQVDVVKITICLHHMCHFYYETIPAPDFYTFTFISIQYFWVPRQSLNRSHSGFHKSEYIGKEAGKHAKVLFSTFVYCIRNDTQNSTIVHVIINKTKYVSSHVSP